LSHILSPEGELVDKTVLKYIYHLGGRSIGVHSLCFHEDENERIVEVKLRKVMTKLKKFLLIILLFNIDYILLEKIWIEIPRRSNS
jgi:hypothetical protein